MSLAPEPTQLTPQFAIPKNWRLADLQDRIGDIPAGRIRMNPPPGYGTEDDVLRIEAEEDVLCELIDGILVEKPMGWYESVLATLLSIEIGIYLKKNNLGKLLGADGSLKILPGTIKIPDVSFISWRRLPKEKISRRPIPALVPDLVVEVLSETNTKKEMDDKLAKYFEAGVALIWYIEPETRSAVSYTALDRFVEVSPTGELDGGDVLPNFKVSLSQLFQQADQQSPE